MSEVNSVTHAFVVIYGGLVEWIGVDNGELDQFIVSSMRAGAKIERVPIHEARGIKLFEPWANHITIGAAQTC